MDLSFGIALVAALFVALVLARLAYRRYKSGRRRRRRALPAGATTRASARSDMRAYDDTSELIDAVARRARPAAPAEPPPTRDPSQRGGGKR